jgi:CDP-diacylglycerol--glycerol-3-phosphate 3-phosphatidyltransferase
MAKTDILLPPNLLSLARIALIPLLGYYLARSNEYATVVSVALIAVAGITDGLDGYLARRLRQETKLGIALDPIADKIFAAALVILLIFFRDFPVWLAVVIIGRDLLILFGGALLAAGRNVTLHSNLTGKYAFAAIVCLLLCHIMRFPFGITVLTYVTLALVAASLVGYARIFRRIRANKPPPQFRDKPIYRAVRTVSTTGLAALLLIKLYLDLLR